MKRVIAGRGLEPEHVIVGWGGVGVVTRQGGAGVVGNR
jgi:hypothetical protein